MVGAAMFLYILKIYKSYNGVFEIYSVVMLIAFFAVSFYIINTNVKNT